MGIADRTLCCQYLGHCNRGTGIAHYTKMTNERVVWVFRGVAAWAGGGWVGGLREVLDFGGLPSQ